MTIKKIKAIMNDNELNKLNYNFDYLSESHRRIQTQINDLVLDAGESNQEVVQARGGHQVLNDRLNSIDSQLAQKPNDWEVRKNYVPIGLNDFDTETLAAIQGGEGTSFSIESVPRDGSVTAKKTTFAKQGKNKFDGVYEPNNVFLDGSQPLGNLAKGSNIYYTAIVEVEGGKSWTVSASGHNRFKIGVSKSKPDIGDEVRVVYFDNSSSQATIDLEPEDRFIIAYVGLGQKPNWLQVEVGNEATPFSDGVVLNVEDRSLSATAVKDVQPTALLTGETASFVVDMNNQKVITRSNGFINHGLESNRLKDGEFSFANSSGLTAVITFDPETKDIKFFTSRQLQNVTYPILGMIRKNTNFVQVNGAHEVIGKPKDNESEIENVHFFLTGDNGEEYIPSFDHIPISTSSPHTVIYDIYDELVNRYPDYITRTELTKDSVGNSVYQYEFVPPKPLGADNYELPTIYYQSALHGHEKNGAIGGAQFFKDLCDRWRVNSALRLLRWNLAFTVVPVVNPSGFDLNQRKNANGVDLARNWPTGWSYENDPDSLYYQGEEPLSELETRAIHDNIMSRTDIIAAIDQHNSGHFADNGYSYWLGASSAVMKKLAASLAFQVDSFSKKEFEYYPQNNVSTSRITDATGGSITSEWNSKGVPAFLLESAPTITADKDRNNPDVQKLTAYQVGNTILGIIRNYKYIK